MKQVFNDRRGNLFWLEIGILNCLVLEYKKVYICKFINTFKS